MKSFENSHCIVVCLLENRDSGVSTESKERNGSGGEVNNGNFTLPLRQHNPGVSPVNFNAPQCSQTTSILPIRTKGCELKSIIKSYTNDARFKLIPETLRRRLFHS